MSKSRLLVLSDLHLEFGPFVPPEPKLFDVVVLAGDIRPGPKAVQWAKDPATFGGKPVIFVPGNHEFYGFERNRALELMREVAAGSNIHLLDRDEVTLNGVRFLGATLWTDFALDEAHGIDVHRAMREGERQLNDFSGLIRQRGRSSAGERRFTPEHSAQEHELSRAWLLEQLQDATSNAVATVVVTHHAPSARSMHDMYAGSTINACFYSELPAEFFQRAQLWVHGHSHSSADYVHHRTRVLSNPRGYIDRSGAGENGEFRNDLVVGLAASAL